MINIFSMQSNQYFSSSFKQRARMRMHICTHGQHTGGKEIDQTATFWYRFFHKTLVQH